jgi:hypothetical protein
VSRNPLVIDAAIAVVIVALVLIIEPGVAIAAILALILLLACGISYLVARRPRRRPRPATPACPRPRRR